VCSLLTVMTATQLHFSSEFLENRTVGWGLAFRRAAEEWYLWGLFAIVILWVARRFPLERGRLGSRLALHVVASMLVSVGYIAAYAWVLHGSRSVDGTVFEFGRVFRKVIIFYVHEHLILYWSLVLAHHGWHYYRRSRERELEAAALETELMQARLTALRMQLNPHFLFNTLNTISALIHERPEDADRMVVRLSELLRLALDEGCPHEVPLERELAFLERYLEVEKIRFEDRLQVEFDIEPGVKQALVPCLVLQPIVENAIRHGIESMDAGGRVRIGARAGRGRLELEVTDNGPGLPAGDKFREGIGLANTRSRLRHLHGEEQELRLDAVAGGGVRVRVTLPLRTAGNGSARAVGG
jgi:LytS/YehU family sensor histidine kinase